MITWIPEQEVQLRDDESGCRADMSAIDVARLAQHFYTSLTSQGLKFAGIFLTYPKLYLPLDPFRADCLKDPLLSDTPLVWLPSPSSNMAYRKGHP